MIVKTPYIVMVYIVAFLLQTTLFSTLPFFDVSANFVLCALVVLNFYSASIAVYVGAIVCGLFLDLGLGQYTGIAALSYLTVSLCLILSSNTVNRNHILTASYTILWSTVLYEFMYWLILVIFGGSYSFTHMLSILPLAMILNGIVASVAKWIKA